MFTFADQRLLLALLLGLGFAGCSSETFIDPPNLCRCSPDEICINEECVPAVDAGIIDASTQTPTTCVEADARINELRSGGVERADFVELIGAPGTSLDGWVVRAFDADGTRRSSAQLSGTLGSDGLWVGAFGGNLEQLPDLDYGATGVVGLAAPSGGIELYDCTGVLRDAVGYGTFEDGAFVGEGTAAATPEPDAAIARCPSEFAMIDMVDSGDNSLDFVQVAATPGEPNPMCLVE